MSLKTEKQLLTLNDTTSAIEYLLLENFYQLLHFNTKVEILVKLSKLWFLPIGTILINNLDDFLDNVEYESRFLARNILLFQVSVQRK